MAGRRRLMFAKDFTVDYLKFTALESGTFSMVIGSRVGITYVEYIEYSIDDGATWTKTDNIDSQTVTVTTPAIATGNSVLWRGSGARMSYSSSGSATTDHCIFSSTGQCNVSGNILTLLGLNKPDTVVNNSFMFGSLFYNMTTLVSAEDLILPSFAARYMYYYAFYGCTSLIKAPSLPAKTLEERCYSCMFQDCTSLTTAPTLPATSLANNCYSYMFRNCTNLTTPPPLLPATTLVDYCYQYMFNSCTSLITAPELPSTTLANNCYSSMFYGCTSLTTAPALPATTLANSCYYNMFYGCSALATAPELPAKTLVNYCYQQMFRGCSSLNKITCLATSISATSCTSTWLYGVAATGTFTKSISMTGWTTGYNGIPSGWTVENNITPFNPQYTFVPSAHLAFSYENTMYLGLKNKCSNQTIYVSKNGTNWHSLQIEDTLEFTANENCYICGSLTVNATNSDYSQFNIIGNFSISGNITSLWDYENLNTVLKSYCGYRMFYECTGLTSIDYLDFSTISYIEYSSFNYMFYKCASLITASISIGNSNTTMSGNGYECAYMFQNCTSLTTAPSLPLKTATKHCYRSMFSGCVSLSTAPQLPATTLEQQCYYYMFNNCSSLTAAPQLPATQLANYCYASMFENCTNLVSAPNLQATDLAEYCYSKMFRYCTSLTTVQNILPASTLKDDCYESMFEGCTSLQTAPELPATIYSPSCYVGMFRGCSDTNRIKALIYLNQDMKVLSPSFSNFTNGVSVTGTFTKSPFTEWTIGTSGIPTGWTIENYYSQFNPQYHFTPSGYLTFTHSDDLYIGLINKCTYQTIYVSKNGVDWHDLQVDDALKFNASESLYVCGNLTTNATNSDYTRFVISGNFSISGNITSLWDYENLSTALKNYCAYHMFDSCTSLISVRDLDFSTISSVGNLSLAHMFRDCTSLVDGPLSIGNSSTVMTGTQGCSYMFFDCSSLASVPSLPIMSINSSCYEDMFYNCTSLIIVPSLPATTLASSCYSYMFQSCTSLTTVNELPAVSLYTNCYSYMFNGCSKLNYIKALYTTSPNTQTSYWVSNVASTGIFVKNINATWTSTGTYAVPTNWTVIYYDPSDGKYYTNRNKTQECDDHGNPI